MNTYPGPVVMGAFADITRKPVLKLKADPRKNVEWLLTASKFLGYPYLPAGERWPVGSCGEEMMLLVQLNFDELPALPGFPSTGLLQFYISGKGRRYGNNCLTSTRQDGWRIIYRPTCAMQPRVLSDGKDPALGRAVSILPLLTAEPMTRNDFRFHEQFLPYYNRNTGRNVESSLHMPGPDFRLMEEMFTLGYSRMGGYTYNTQGDPRLDERYRGYTVTLLQVILKSDILPDCQSSSILSFFIKPENLEALDFSDVLFTVEE